MKWFYFSAFLCVCCIITCKGQKIFVDSLMPLVFQEYHTDTRADGIDKKVYIGLRVFIAPKSSGFAIYGKRLNKLMPISPSYTNKYYRILDVVSSNDWPDKIGSDKDIVKLQEEKSGEIIYYTEPNKLISMALFEKRKREYSDNYYLYVGQTPAKYVDPFTYRVVSIPINSIWESTYTVLSKGNSSDAEYGLLLKNNKGESVFIPDRMLGRTFALKFRLQYDIANERQAMRGLLDSLYNVERRLNIEKKHTIVYDSLSPLSCTDNISKIKAFIGQSIFLPKPRSLDHYSPIRNQYNLYTTKYTSFKFGAPYYYNGILYDYINTNLYQPEELNEQIGNTQGSAYYQSNLDSIAGRHYLINDIIPLEASNLRSDTQNLKIECLQYFDDQASQICTFDETVVKLFQKGAKYLFELICEDTREIVYTCHISHFIVDGYLTKLRDVFERKNLIATNVCCIHDLLSGNTLKFDKSEKIYCQSIEIYDGKIIGKFVADVDGQQKQIAFNIEPRLNEVYLGRILDFEDRSMLTVKSLSIEDFVLEEVVRMEIAKREQQKREEAQKKLQQKEAAKRAINLKQIQ